MAAEPIKFLRWEPYKIDPETRVAQLKEYLNHKEYERYRLSILKLIEMYESGELGPLTDGPKIYLVGGVVLDREPSLEEVCREPGMWVEGFGHQYVQQSQPQAISRAV